MRFWLLEDTSKGAREVRFFDSDALRHVELCIYKTDLAYMWRMHAIGMEYIHEATGGVCNQTKYRVE